MMNTKSNRNPLSVVKNLLGRNKFASDAISLTMGKGLNLVLGVLSTLVFGTVFSTHNIAVISLFDVVLHLVFAIGINWSSAGVIRFGKEELQKKNSLSHTTSTRLHVVLPVILLAIGLIIYFRESVLNYLHYDDPALIWYLVASLIVLTVHEHVTSVLETREKHFSNAMFYVAQGAAKLLILVAFLSGMWETSVLTYVAASVWFDVLILMFRLPSCGKSFLHPLTRVSGQELRTFLWYVVPQLYGFAGLYVIDSIDVYFIERYCTMNDLGAYQYLYSIFQRIAVMAFVANSLLFPRIMAWKQEEPAAIPRFTQRFPQLTMLATMVGTSVLLLIYEPCFNGFFDDEYSVAYPAFSLMICALPCYFISFMFIPVLNSFDRVPYIQTVNILSAVVNFAVDFLLVPRVGIIGAAAGTFAAFWLNALLLMIPVHRQFGVKWKLIFGLHLALGIFAVTRFMAGVDTW